MPREQRRLQPRQDSGLSFIPNVKPLFLLLALIVVSQILFMVGLDRVPRPYFDELLYVPAARDLVSGAAFTTVEQPLIGKLLIGLGIVLTGDNAIGWRLMATIAGTATIAAVFSLAQLAFKDARISVTAALLTLLNQLVFIQARIAMLDVFLGAFLLWGIYYFIRGLQNSSVDRARRDLLISGAFFGLACATKWAAIPYVIAALALCYFGRSLPFLSPAVQDAEASESEPAALSPAARAASVGGAAVLVYLVSFLPALLVERNALSLSELLSHQLEMYRLQARPVAPHPYMSSWIQWPFAARPVWYLHEDVDNVRRAVLLVGNPAVMWGGLGAVCALLVAAVRQKSGQMILFPALFLFGMAAIALFPGAIGFYYHYYVPALFLSLSLAVALAVFFQRGRLRVLPPAFLGVALALFVYFYPVISGAALEGPMSFENWMWFDSWR